MEIIIILVPHMYFLRTRCQPHSNTDRALCPCWGRTMSYIGWGETNQRNAVFFVHASTIAAPSDRPSSGCIIMRRHHTIGLSDEWR